MGKECCRSEVYSPWNVAKFFYKLESSNKLNNIIKREDLEYRIRLYSSVNVLWVIISINMDVVLSLVCGWYTV